MKVFLNEIKNADSRLHFSEKDKWIFELATRLDELPETAQSIAGVRPSQTRPHPKTLSVDFTLRRIDTAFEVKGNLTGALNLLCSRCTNPIVFQFKRRFSLIYSTDPHLISKTHRLLPTDANFDDDPFDPVAEPEVEIDINLLEQDFIDLEQILTEQLLLQIPLQPLCKVDCKGICQHCGADLNNGRCACASIRKETQFAALVQIKDKIPLSSGPNSESERREQWPPRRKK